jgi:hypothetical protein
MHCAMMPATERDREFIADFAAERARLSKSEVVGIGRLAAAQETSLLGDVAQMPPVAIAAGRCDRKDALVDALGAFGDGIHLGPGNLSHRRIIL